MKAVPGAVEGDLAIGAGATCAMLRLPTHEGGWVPVHVTVNRVQLDDDTFAGLVSLRLPTESELAAADLTDTL